MDMRMVNGKGKRGRGSDGLRCGSTSGAGRLTRCRRHLECALWQRWHLCAAPWPMRTPRRVGAVERSFETRARGSGLECDAACVPGPGRACLTLRRDPRWVCAARARRSSRRRRPSGRRRSTTDHTRDTCGSDLWHMAAPDARHVPPRRQHSVESSDA